MLDFDEEKVADRIIAEGGKETRYFTLGLAHDLKNVQECLVPAVEAWLRGERPKFEFNGITLEDTFKLFGSTYAHAIVQMDKVVRKNETLEEYQTFWDSSHVRIK